MPDPATIKGRRRPTVRKARGNVAPHRNLDLSDIAPTRGCVIRPEVNKMGSTQQRNT